MLGFIMARVAVVLVMDVGFWVLPLSAMYIFAPR